MDHWTACDVLFDDTMQQFIVVGIVPGTFHYQHFIDRTHDLISYCENDKMTCEKTTWGLGEASKVNKIIQE